MKYFKFAKISAESGISWAIEQPLSGPSFPSLPGLTNIIQLDHTNGLYYLGRADDSAVEEPSNHIWELTLEDYAEELKTHVQHNINQRLNKIYDEENDFRKAILGKYDNTATIAGVYKYEQALAYAADNTLSVPQLEAEAAIREISVAEIAQRIITNHEKFRIAEAKIAGIRGLVYDRLTTFEFDVEDPDTSYAEFISEEVIGTTLENRPNLETGENEEVSVDVKTQKYQLNISTRYKFLG